jgi:hypothetical protein
MLPGANVLIDVVRLRQPVLNLPLSTPLTMPDATPFLVGEEARASDPPTNNYVIVQPSQAASAGIYLFAVEAAVDIVPTDHLIKIVNIDDGLTPWPEDSILPNPNEQWIVRFVRVLPGPSGGLERWCWVERVMLGGSLHLMN